ncbi:hypothetical protein GYB62_02190, partial [bacterium]|nr:hypothetical protein [bacterium]
QDEGGQASVFITPKAQWQTDNSAYSITLFARWDDEDNERSHADIREATWLYVADDWELKLGMGKVFWGVTETQHLVDIINQTDAVEFIDGEEKLGQPMLQLSTIRDWGVLDLFVLPYFRERTFSAADARLSGGLDLSADAIYESSAEEQHIDFSLRYSHVIGPIDLGVSYFEGTNRQPVYVPVSPLSPFVFAPYYDQLQQFGIDAQATLGSWLWKLEAVARDDSFFRYAASTAGFEYTFYGIGDSVIDSGWLLEFSRDSRGLRGSAIAQKDIAIAQRLAFNDVGSSEILLGATVDLDDESVYTAFVEASRRFGNNWKFNLDAWLFAGERPADITTLIRRDDFVQLSVAYYF